MKFWTAFIASILIAGCAQAAEKTDLTIDRADGAAVTFHVERATTDETRARGLMFRESLAPDDGMIFLYDRPGNTSFWMKNTLIPLDMVFFNDKGEVTHIEVSAKPQSLEPRGPNRSDTCAVLEIGGGQAARHGLKTGDKLRTPDGSPCLP